MFRILNISHACLASLVLTVLIVATPRMGWAGGLDPCPTAGEAIEVLQISQLVGGFSGPLLDGDFFGRAVCPLGDLDADGTDDIAVGAMQDDDGGLDRGAVWILFLNPDGTVKSEQKISSTSGGFTGTLDNSDFFGASLCSLGDLDSDGVVDLAIGAYQDDDGGSNSGAVWIVFLNSNGTVKSHTKISATSGGFGGVITGSAFGISLTKVGDLDEDGVDDLAIGAIFTNDVGAASGAIWITYFNADGTVKAEQKVSASSPAMLGSIQSGDRFGIGVAGIGDMDGDGVEDVAVGGYLSDDGGPDRGAVWVLFLNSNGTVGGFQKISAVTGGFGGHLDDGDRFGYAVAFAGDVDGDGVGDIAVSALEDDDGGSDRGAAWILFLNGDGTVKREVKLSSNSLAFAKLLEDEDRFGRSVSVIAGSSETSHLSLAVGADDDDGGTDRGAVWIIELDGCPPLPFVISHPQSALLPVDGGIVIFEVIAVGEEVLTYQWRKEGVDLVDGGNLSGSTTSMLTIDATLADVGLYDCIVSNDFGFAASDTAVLGVRPSCLGDLVSNVTFAPPPDGVVDAADLAFLLGAWGPCD